MGELRRQDPEPWRVEGGHGGRTPPKLPNRLRFGAMLVLLLAVNWIASSLLLAPEPRTVVSYTFFLTQVQSSNVAHLAASGDTIEGEFTTTAAYTPYGSTGSEQVDRFTTRRPPFADDNLFAQLQANGVPVNARPPDARPLWQRVLLGFGPALLLAGSLVWLRRRHAAGNSGRSRATPDSPASAPRTTFADVAGIKETGELAEIVDFLREPRRYHRLGARMPPGVLLSGPPGTGKTLLARAVAGEAEVPFFSISAAEPLIVESGAGRVRDLFERARTAAPSVVLIDDLDAIGRPGGRGQLLNQILTEMDALPDKAGVVVLAATNRAESLDQALLRPGRFDRRVTVSPPGRTGRREILEVHTRGVPLAGDVRLDDLAAAADGMVGADLRNLVNEAALLAARRRHETVRAVDLSDALAKSRRPAR